MPIKIVLILDDEVKLVTSEEEAKSLEAQGWERIDPSKLTPEQQLELETGHDVVQTGEQPPTYVETDDPVPDTDEE